MECRGVRGRTVEPASADDAEIRPCKILRTAGGTRRQIFGLVQLYASRIKLRIWGNAHIFIFVFHIRKRGNLAHIIASLFIVN